MLRWREICVHVEGGAVTRSQSLKHGASMKYEVRYKLRAKCARRRLTLSTASSSWLRSTDIFATFENTLGKTVGCAMGDFVQHGSFYRHRGQRIFPTSKTFSCMQPLQHLYRCLRYSVGFSTRKSMPERHRSYRGHTRDTSLTCFMHIV